MFFQKQARILMYFIVYLLSFVVAHQVPHLQVPHLGTCRCCGTLGPTPAGPTSWDLQVLWHIRSLGTCRCCGTLGVLGPAGVVAHQVPHLQVPHLGTCRCCGTLGVLEPAGVVAHQESWNLQVLWHIRSHTCRSHILEPAGVVAHQESWNLQVLWHIRSLGTCRCYRGKLHKILPVFHWLFDAICERTIRRCTWFELTRILYKSCLSTVSDRSLVVHRSSCPSTVSD